MNKLKLTLALTAAVLMGGLWAADSQAQVVVYGPSVASRVIVPAPVTVYRSPVVTAYRPALPSYVAPVTTYRSYNTYNSYRPVYPVAPVVAPTLYRPTVVGPGIGGLPNRYVPGQPIRNALRFAVP